MEPRGWHWRGYLPHFDGGEVAQAVTFRLADSLPAPLLAQWREEPGEPLDEQARSVRHWREQTELDRGEGAAWLARPQLADLVQSALLWADGRRYELHAWVVMPNHVHALFTPMAPYGLGQIVHSWKSYTAHRANELLSRQRAFWHADYYDRHIRDRRHFHTEVTYIEGNPVGASLCDRPEDWPWSSASWRAATEPRRPE